MPSISNLTRDEEEVGSMLKKKKKVVDGIEEVAITTTNIHFEYGGIKYASMKAALEDKQYNELPPLKKIDLALTDYWGRASMIRGSAYTRAMRHSCTPYDAEPLSSLAEATLKTIERTLRT